MTFEYRHAAVVRVVDGDTARLNLDLGNAVRWEENFRLAGIDAPERGTPGADAATGYLEGLLSAGLSRVVTHKPDKYGRWLVDLYIAAPQGGEQHVNRAMVVGGFAVEYSGGVR